MFHAVWNLDITSSYFVGFTLFIAEHVKSRFVKRFYMDYDNYNKIDWQRL